MQTQSLKDTLCRFCSFKSTGNENVWIPVFGFCFRNIKYATYTKDQKKAQKSCFSLKYQNKLSFQTTSHSSNKLSTVEKIASKKTKTLYDDIIVYLSWKHNESCKDHCQHVQLADPDVWIYVAISNCGECYHGEPQGLKQVKLAVAAALKVLHSTHTEDKSKISTVKPI